MAKIRLLVTGGRDFANKSFLHRSLDFLNIHTKDGIECVINGYARGADRLADEWALERGFILDSTLFREPADWKRYGNTAAGPIRNQLMLDKHKPNLVAAFTGENGTADMVRRSIDFGLLVLHFADKESRITERL